MTNDIGVTNNNENNIPKLRFKEFSRKWEEKRLGNITSYFKGYAFKSNDYKNEGIRIVRVSDLSANDIKEEGSHIFISKDVSKDYQKYQIKADDIIITTVGSKPEMRESAVGRPIYIYTKDNGFLNQNLLILRSNDISVSGFIFPQLLSERYYNHIISIKRGNANQSNITVKDLNDFRIRLTNIDEQRKIAGFLVKIDKYIEHLSKKNVLLEQYKKGVLQRLLNQELRFKDNKGNDFNNWQELKLNNFLKLDCRSVEKPKSNYHALGVRSHFKGLFDKIDSDPTKISMGTLYRVQENDVVVNITFAWEGAMAVARSEHNDGLVSHRFPTYRCDESIMNLVFFNYRFVQKDFLHQLNLCSPGGAGRNRVLNKKRFLQIKIATPCIEEQTKIANFLTAIDKKIDQTTKKLELAKQWKKGLLQQMFV